MANNNNTTNDKKFQDLTGQVFGRLIARERVKNFRSGRTYWMCSCECGKETHVKTSHLTSGNTRSCGCLEKESRFGRRKTHGESRGLKNTPEWRCWCYMKSRCNNPKNARYADWGGRGIGVCERWSGKDGFANFIVDMGRKPTKRHSIDRIDNNKGYSKENCRWATPVQKSRNKRIRKSNVSGCEGVALRRSGIWVATITVCGRHIFLGCFSVLESAVAARKAAELKYWV